MRTLGLIGGMSWESTLPYYRLINEGIRHRLGGLHSARLLLYSVDFDDIAQLQHAGDWDAAGRMLADAANALARAGAQGLVLCTNTMHKVADAITTAVPLPLLHIVDITADALRRRGIRRAGLLATRFTMEDAFYRDRLASQGIEAVVPPPGVRAEIHRIIYDELCQGLFHDDARARFRAAMTDLVADGAEGIVLGCTEIGLLVRADDAAVPLFDTTSLHAAAAVDWALGDAA